MRSHESILRIVLGINAGFSLISAATVRIGETHLGRLVGLTVAECRTLALNLAVFAVLLAVLATRRTLLKRWILRTVLLIAVLDLLWVVGSVQALVSGLALAQPTGRWLVGIVGVLVGGFGAAEIYLWWDLRRTPGDQCSDPISR